jgi:hypothetical protein
VKRAACLLALALLASGCGGGGDRLSKSAYEAKLRTSFAWAFGRATALPITPGNVATGYSTIARNLKRLHPPANVQSLNSQLVDGASKQAAALDALDASIKGKTKAVRDRILAQFDPSDIAGRREFDRAVAALEAKGYKFRPNGGT